MRRAAYNLLHAPSTSRPGRSPGVRATGARATGSETGSPVATDGDATTQADAVPVEELARRLGVLAHPIRLGILRRLLSTPSCVTDFVEALGEDQPKISQHLKVLRDSGLLACRADGRRRCYSVRQPALVQAVLDALAALDPEAVPAGEDDCLGDPSPGAPSPG